MDVQPLTLSLAGGNTRAMRWDCRVFPTKNGTSGRKSFSRSSKVCGPNRKQIADRMQEFFDIGVTTFLLQFHPMQEEMQRFGEQVVPLLAKAGIWVHPSRSST